MLSPLCWSMLLKPMGHVPRFPTQPLYGGHTVNVGVELPALWLTPHLASGLSLVTTFCFWFRYAWILRHVGSNCQPEGAWLKSVAPSSPPSMKCVTASYPNRCSWHRNSSLNLKWPKHNHFRNTFVNKVMLLFIYYPQFFLYSCSNCSTSYI